jgi:hypothetical protein
MAGNRRNYPGRLSRIDMLVLALFAIAGGILALIWLT